MNNVARTAYIAHLMYFGIACVETLIVNFAEILWTLIVSAKIGGKNMNEIERAIATYKEIIKESEEFLRDEQYSEALEKEIKEQMEISAISIQALQEKAEREKGCEYCNSHKPLLTLYSEYSIEVDGREMSVWQGLKCEEIFEISYCPMCGRKLVEE